MTPDAWAALTPEERAKRQRAALDRYTQVNTAHAAQLIAEEAGIHRCAGCGSWLWPDRGCPVCPPTATQASQ